MCWNALEVTRLQSSGFLLNYRFSLPWIWNCSAGERQTYQIYSKHRHKALARWLYSTGSEMKQHVSCWVMLVEPYPFYATHTHTATLIEFSHQDIFGPFCHHRRQGFPISLHLHNLAPRCMSGGSRDVPQSDPNSKRPTHRMHKDHKGVPKGKYIPCSMMFSNVQWQVFAAYWQVEIPRPSCATFKRPVLGFQGIDRAACSDLICHDHLISFV